MSASTPSALDALLSAGSAPGGLFDPARLLALDEAEAFPSAQAEALLAVGVAAGYVPARWGGRLDSYPALMRTVRGLAACDLTLAIAHAKTFLGCVCVWVAAQPEQAKALAARVIDGAVVAWALTERGHGSDLLAGTLAARREGAGWRLDGEKWLINNATRGDLACVLARTAPEGGARGFSLFLVDKRRLPDASLACLPGERLHGLRGADISGLRFDGAMLPADAIVGGEGKGLEIVLKSLQLTRTLCVGLSLGAMDHAARLAGAFVGTRRLYGQDMARLPMVRLALGEAAAMALAAQAVAQLAARAVHVLPRQMSVVSALAKALVPTLADRVVAALGDLMGLRAFLRAGEGDGMFQKLERDHRIVGLFDGSTAVNRQALVNQLGVLSRPLDPSRAPDADLALLADVSRPLPEADPARLALLAVDGCVVLHALPALVHALRDDPRLGQGAAALLRATDEVLAAMAALHADGACRGVDVPSGAYALVRRYELCFAGACCLLAWRHNAVRLRDDPLWRDGLWIQTCLDWLVTRLDGQSDVPPGCAELVEVLDARGASWQLFPEEDGHA